MYIITEEKRGDAANEKLVILEKEAVSSYLNALARLRHVRRQDAENMEAAKNRYCFFLFLSATSFVF